MRENDRQDKLGLQKKSHDAMRRGCCQWRHGGCELSGGSELAGECRIRLIVVVLGGGNVYVACSTLCFARRPLEEALQIIADMRFAKVDLAIHEDSSHVKPTQVAADVPRTAQMLKSLCPLGLAAFHVRIETEEPVEYDRQFRAICRLARLLLVPLVCIDAPSTQTPLEVTLDRLKSLVRIAHAEGIIPTVETLTGTWTEMPETAVELCQRIPGLGLTLDPSHYLVGPARGNSFDAVYPFVRHVRLRDTGAGPHEFQVRVGQGHVDYGKIITYLTKHRYDRLLTVDIRDVADSSFAMEPEVRKLKYLLESLI
jgi:sugar phosphate isomerase/epimerase